MPNSSLLIWPVTCDGWIGCNPTVPETPLGPRANNMIAPDLSIEVFSKCHWLSNVAEGSTHLHLFLYSGEDAEQNIAHWRLGWVSLRMVVVALLL